MGSVGNTKVQVTENDWQPALSAYKANGPKGARKIKLPTADNTTVYIQYHGDSKSFNVFYETAKTTFGRYVAKNADGSSVGANSRKEAIRKATDWINNYYLSNWRKLQKQHGEI